MTAEEQEFRRRLEAAESVVAAARNHDSKQELADALRALGNIQRRPPELRDAANRTYKEAADLYDEIGLPLDEAWVTRHIGINHEYADRLTDAEEAYENALALYRLHSATDDLDYANAVRYVAVIKGRVEKREEAEPLWTEAVERYEKVGIVEGIAEGTAHLTLFALEKGDLDLARIWFARAEAASSRSNDPATHRFVDDIRARLDIAS
jgi:tetratricopeptide (TPR) repeat protein